MPKKETYPLYQINYVYYYSLPMMGQFTCEKHKIGGFTYKTKEAAQKACDQYNARNERRGHYEVKVCSDGK